MVFYWSDTTKEKVEKKEDVDVSAVLHIPEFQLGPRLRDIRENLLSSMCLFYFTEFYESLPGLLRPLWKS